MENIYIKNIPTKGRGVVAGKNFSIGEVIEVCPVIVLSKTDSQICEQTLLGNYIYEWSHPDDGAIILGYGLLYNHSYTPNAQYDRDFQNLTLTYTAIRNISAGEEITVNYNGEPEDPTPIDWIKELV